MFKAASNYSRPTTFSEACSQSEECNGRFELLVELLVSSLLFCRTQALRYAARSLVRPLCLLAALAAHSLQWRKKLAMRAVCWLKAPDHPTMQWRCTGSAREYGVVQRVRARRPHLKAVLREAPLGEAAPAIASTASAAACRHATPTRQRCNDVRNGRRNGEAARRRRLQRAGQPEPLEGCGGATARPRVPCRRSPLPPPSPSPVPPPSRPPSPPPLQPLLLLLIAAPALLRLAKRATRSHCAPSPLLGVCPLAVVRTPPRFR